jgi:dihydrofolate reductase
MSVSVDGFFEGPEHDIGWHLVDEEVHAYVNGTLRGMSAFLEGRRVYELMESYWPTADEDPDSPEPVREFAGIWRETPKIVYSRTLESVGPNATLEREVDPDAVRALKAQDGGDMSLGGADLLRTFLGHGLVDEFWLYVNPVVIGKGTPLFPDDVRLALTLLETRRFANGVVRNRYAVAT